MQQPMHMQHAPHVRTCSWTNPLASETSSRGATALIALWFMSALELTSTVRIASASVAWSPAASKQNSAGHDHNPPDAPGSRVYVYQGVTACSMQHALLSSAARPLGVSLSLLFTIGVTVYAYRSWPDIDRWERPYTRVSPGGQSHWPVRTRLNLKPKNPQWDVAATIRTES